MNIYNIIANILMYFALGCLFGVPVSLFTVILMRRLAKRVERYQLTYEPMTLVESTLWKWALIAYPLAFGLSFIVLYALKLIRL